MNRLFNLMLVGTLFFGAISCDDEDLDWVLEERAAVLLALDIEAIPADPGRSIGDQVACTLRVRNEGDVNVREQLNAGAFAVQISVDGSTTPVATSPAPVSSDGSSWDGASNLWNIESLPKGEAGEATLSLTLDLVGGAGTRPCISAVLVRPEGMPPDPDEADDADSECFDISTGPAIGLSDRDIEFVAAVGGGDPATQIVDVTNAGTGTLGGFGASVNYDGGQPTGWLSANLDATSAPTQLRVSARTGSLGEGVYGATISVSAPAATNSPQEIRVSFTVAAEPAIGLSRSSVDVNAEMGGADPPAETVDVGNVGTGTLTGLTASVAYGPGAADWLDASLDGTTAPATLTLQAMTGILALGNYSATVSIVSAAAINSPQTIDVSFTVSEGPAIGLSDSSFDVELQSGLPGPATRIVSITNTGGGPLTGLSASVSYGAGEPTGWLSPSLDQTTAPATLTLEISSAALAAGSYTATVSVSSPVAGNSPQDVLVNLSVTPAPSIGLGSDQATFNALEGGGDPGTRQISITNAGGGTLSELSTSIEYAVGEPTGWLSAGLSGTTAPAALQLDAITGGLAAGSYTATVSVTSPVADNSPAQVTVRFDVIGPILSLSTNSANFNAREGGPSPAPADVFILNVGGGTLSGLSAGISYGGGEPTGWLAAEFDQTTAPATLTLTAGPGILPAGDYSATVRVDAPGALNAPQDIAVQLSIGAAPLISLSTNVANFGAVEAGADPADILVDIDNAGGGVLAGLDASISYGAAEPTGWLSAGLDVTTAPATLTLQAFTAGLAPGSYSATVSVSSPDAPNSPQDIGVSFDVSAAPLISVSQDSLHFDALEGAADPAPQLVSIGNAGGGVLDGLISGISYTDGSGWLSANFSGGTTAPTDLEIAVTTGALAPGSYAATVSLSSSSALNSPQDIAVSLVVAAAPRIELSSFLASFNAFEGGADPDSQLIAVSNVGGGVLTDLAANISYGTGAGWLDAAFLDGTTAPANLRLRASAPGLAGGVYDATVSISSSVAINSPQDIAVSFTVVGPEIQLSTTALAFATHVGGADPDSQLVDIANIGGGTLTGLSANVRYNGGPPSERQWLTVTLHGGDTAPTALTAKATPGVLGVGSYTATISVESAVAGNSPQEITVGFDVLAAEIELPTSTAIFSAFEAGPDPAAQIVTVGSASGGTLANLSTSVNYGGGEPTGWLDASFLGGNAAPADLTLAATTGALPAGNYNATVSVISADATNSPQDIAVSFEVVGPSMGLSSTTADFVAAFGGADPASQIVSVSNLGGGTLANLSASVSYGAGEPTGWLDASFLGGDVAPADLTLTASLGALAAGDYSATVSVLSPDASNSPKLIAVSFSVTP